MSKPLDLEQMKKIQLEIMDEIDSFCKDHNYQYFLGFGSLIGAVRHKGFIPWDDDIDIVMPRKDYSALIEKFSSNSGNIEILNPNKAPGYLVPYAKAVHKKTILIEKGGKKSTGVFVDIFPIDSVPDDKSKYTKLNDRVSFFKNILTLKYLRVEKERNIIKNFVVMCGKVLKCVPDKILINKINKLQQSFTGESDKVSTMTGIYGTNEVVSKKCFSKGIYADFEDRKYVIPIGYDEYLTSIYGNYMELPPIEKRISHHGYSAFWKE